MLGCEGLRVKCILVANCRYVKLTRCKLLLKNSTVGFLSHIALMQLDEKCEKSCFRCSYFLPIDSNFYLCFFLYQVLIGITSAGKPLRGFNAKELLPAECLSSLVGLLSESSVKPSLHTKSMALLFNLGE